MSYHYTKQQGLILGCAQEELQHYVYMLLVTIVQICLQILLNYPLGI